MEDFNQILETSRFLEVLDELISRQIVKSDADFCRKMEYSPQSFNQVRKQKRNVTIQLISKLHDTYGGNPLYIFTGEGEKIVSQRVSDSINNYKVDKTFENKFTNQNTVDVVKELLAENETLRKVIDIHADSAKISAKYISSLEKQIQKLNEGTVKKNDE